MTWAANYDYAMDTSTYSLGASVGVATGMADLAAGYKLREDSTTELTASATHTTEGGAALSLAYENDNGAGASGDSDYLLNTLVATASYSF